LLKKHIGEKYVFSCLLSSNVSHACTEETNTFFFFSVDYERHELWILDQVQMVTMLLFEK